jgi:MYXO-CTERM domain-containing protein
VNFVSVSGLSAPTQFADNAATSYSFNPVTAQYARIVGVSGPNAYNLLNQVLLFGPAVPEPSTVALGGFGLAALVTLALRRRRAV